MESLALGQLITAEKSASTTIVLVSIPCAVQVGIPPGSAAQAVSMSDATSARSSSSCFEDCISVCVDLFTSIIESPSSFISESRNSRFIYKFE